MNKQEFTFDITGTICCDDCGNVYHSFFDCPICGHEDAGTSMWHDAYEMDVDEEFECKECAATFKLIWKPTTYDYSDWVWELVEKNE